MLETEVNPRPMKYDLYILTDVKYNHDVEIQDCKFYWNVPKHVLSGSFTLAILVF